MKTERKSAFVQLRDGTTAEILPTIKLEGGLVLVRMDNPGPVGLLVLTEQLARLTVTLDGVQVMSPTEPLQPGENCADTYMCEGLVFRPQPAPVQWPVDDHERRADEAYLRELGVEPAFAPNSADLPYIGADGGVIKVSLTYLVEDNSVFFETGSEEFTFKLNTGDDFKRAVASNAYRIAFTPGAKTLDAPDLCGLCRLHSKQGDDHHH